MVFIDVLTYVKWRFYEHSDLNLAIGERMYYFSYLGHQINKDKSIARDKLLQMYNLIFFMIFFMCFFLFKISNYD